MSMNFRQHTLPALAVVAALVCLVACGSSEGGKVGLRPDTECINVLVEYDELAAPPVEVTVRLDPLWVDDDSIMVNWGDSEEWFPAQLVLPFAVKHTYSTSGEYTVRIRGRGSNTGQTVTTIVTVRIALAVS